jgi:hypothetical protein
MGDRPGSILAGRTERCHLKGVVAIAEHDVWLGGHRKKWLLDPQGNPIEVYVVFLRSY